jgi:hypothetical protein
MDPRDLRSLDVEPAISPFWSNATAYTSDLSVVEVSELATPASTTTTFGPVPIRRLLARRR